MKHRSNEIVQLSEIDHVLKRSQMYIGATSRSTHQRWVYEEDSIVQKEVDISPGLLKLFDEIISNSIDEALRTNFEFANKIDVAIDGNTIKVSDNGRGIPVVPIGNSNVTQAEMAFTSLRAGANFGEESVVSIGTNGLGSTLVNIMSLVFRAETCDGKNKLSLVCTKNLSEKTIRISKCNTHGTSVEYTPDFSLFENCDNITSDDHKMIVKRIFDLSVCFPKITFTLNNKKINAGSANNKFKKYVALYSSDAQVTIDNDYMVAVFPTEEPTHVSFVNGIDTFEGGAHVKIVQDIIINRLLEAFSKKFKKLKIKSQDIKNHLGFIVFTNSIKAAKFRSQTKEYISNTYSEIKPIFTNLESDTGFINSILKSDVLIDPIIESKRLKLEAAERLAVKHAAKNAKKNKVAKHVQANSKDPRKKILFISEGASASGQLLSVRDPDIHGSYPLRGKVMNINGMKPSEILKNEELKNLMAIIGLNIGHKAEDLDYGKIVIMTDSDFDGSSISGALINFFALWPELFHEHKVVLLETPIVIANKGKVTKRYYTLNEYEKDTDKLVGFDCTYIKGLGSLSLEEYKLIINSPRFVNVVYDSIAKDKLEMAFGSDSALRKDWLAA